MPCTSHLKMLLMACLQMSPFEGLYTSSLDGGGLFDPTSIITLLEYSI